MLYPPRRCSRGRVVVRLYRSDRLHMQHSLTKSVTACGVGLAIAEGRFGLDDKVVYVLRRRGAGQRGAGIVAADGAQSVDHADRAWRRRVRLGLAADHLRAGSPEFFKLPLVHEPGTTFVYNSASSFMPLGTDYADDGKSLRDYLEPRLFQPLGMRNLQWDLGPGGINPGGNGLSWSTLDTLKLGLLHLQQGEWDGRASLTRILGGRGNHGPQAISGRYGYQWWLGPSHQNLLCGGLVWSILLCVSGARCGAGVHGWVLRMRSCGMPVWRLFSGGISTVSRVTIRCVSVAATSDC